MPRNTTSPLDRFTAEAASLPSDELRISVPYHVLLGEAVDVARFFDKYFDSVPARDNKPARPGLDTVVDKKKGLTADTGKDLLALRAAVQEAHTAYLMCAAPRGVAPMERGRVLVDELFAVLEWHFDDGVEDERDAQLASVVQAHDGTPDSADALAAELDDYAALASAYRKEIDGVGGFKASTIEEAKALAAELRDRPPSPMILSEEARRALALQNRLGTLLGNKMSTVRAAARFVFRSSPEIVREVTSAYERRRRASSRKNPSGKRASPPAPAPQ